jgi:hypothetical protein
MSDTKPSNPKDAFGSAKLPLHLVPDTMVNFAALAFLEGSLKYGQYNWRIAGVRTSIYVAAMRRHISKFQNGEWADPKTKVPHLANALACIAIILDANVSGQLTDDRPPIQEANAKFIDECEQSVAHLKDLFKDHSPTQYTRDHSPLIVEAAFTEVNKRDTRRPRKARRR